MAHKFTFTISVELTRTSGKFASLDELADAIKTELEGTDPGSISGVGVDGDSDYEVTSFEVAEADA